MISQGSKSIPLKALAETPMDLTNVSVMTLQAGIGKVEVKGEGTDWIFLKEGSALRTPLKNPRIRSSVDETIIVGINIDIFETAQSQGTVTIDANTIAALQAVTLNAAAQTAVQNSVSTAINAAGHQNVMTAAFVAALTDAGVTAALTSAFEAALTNYNAATNP